MRNLFVSVLGLMLLGGCAADATDSATTPTAATTDSEIVGGTETTAFPAIIALFAHKQGENQGSLCTATLISPTVLLTAAHCVAPATVGVDQVFTALTGPSLVDAANPSGSLAVAETHFDPQFDDQNLPNGHDIAVAILAAPYTAATPMPWNKNALPASLTGKNIHAVGYGLNDGFGQKGAGVKREADLKLNKFDTKLLSTGGFGKTICNGDSGGPILATLNGVQTIIGVNSFGLAFCIGSSSSTRVDTYKSFIQQWL